MGTTSGSAGNPFQQNNPFQQQRRPAPGPRTAPSAAGPSAGAVLFPIALSVVVNLMTLAGVLVFGWPPGNAYVLFWIENLVVGVANVPRIATARGTDATPVRTRGVSNSPGGLAVFFCFHYGLFCLVHGVFTGVVAFAAGFDPSFLFLGLPAILIVIRYTVETATTWWGTNGLRWTMSPARTMFSVYPRIIVLQVAVIIAFMLTLSRIGTSRREPDQLQQVLATLPPQLQDPKVLVVLILVVIKLLVDCLTTWRAVTGAGRTPRRIVLERSP